MDITGIEIPARHIVGYSFSMSVQASQTSSSNSITSCWSTPGTSRATSPSYSTSPSTSSNQSTTTNLTRLSACAKAEIAAGIIDIFLALILESFTYFRRRGQCQKQAMTGTIKVKAEQAKDDELFTRLISPR